MVQEGNACQRHPTKTYPGRILLAYRKNPYPDWRVFFTLQAGDVILAELAIAYILGLMVWRSLVIARFLNKLGCQFKLKTQPKHPDRSGGLKPLGDLSLANTFVILAPVIIFAVLLALLSLPKYVGLTLWSQPFQR